MITTGRDCFLGSHVTPDLKAALKKEAKKRELSVSHLVFTLLHERLKAEGHSLGYKYLLPPLKK